LISLKLDFLSECSNGADQGKGLICYPAVSHKARGKRALEWIDPGMKKMGALVMEETVRDTNENIGVDVDG